MEQKRKNKERTLIWDIDDGEISMLDTESNMSITTTWAKRILVVKRSERDF